MSDILQIRSKEELFNDIVVSGLKGEVRKDDIRAALIDAIRKEVFGQMAWRMKVDDPMNALHTPKNEEIVKNIAIQARKKWSSLMKECNKYKETLNLIKAEDLNDIWAGEEEAEDEDERSPGDWDGDERTAEWPELSK